MCIGMWLLFTSAQWSSRMHNGAVGKTSFLSTNCWCEESVIDSCHNILNLTNELMVRLAPRSSTHRGKPLSRINPICVTGGSLHRICETNETRCELDSQESVGEGKTGKKDKATPDAGGKSVSEKSQVTYTNKNPLRNNPVITRNYLFVWWRTNGLGRMVLSSSSGGVTFLLTNMIRGKL